jgi:hypothetical protein
VATVELSIPVSPPCLLVMASGMMAMAEGQVKAVGALHGRVPSAVFEGSIMPSYCIIETDDGLTVVERPEG